MENNTLLAVTQAASGSTSFSVISQTDVGTFPSTSGVSCYFEDQNSSYSAFYNATSKSIDVYENSITTSSYFTSLKSTTISDSIDCIEPFTLGGNTYFCAYAAGSAYINFYALQSDFSLSKVYSGYIGKGYTTVKPLTYRNSVFFVAYDQTSGAVCKYQIMATSKHPIYINKTWSDTWAQQWVRFAFFQFGGENFFIKANLNHKKVNIDHFMDDLTESSHPVLNEAAPQYMLDAVDVKTFQDQHGNAFFAVAESSSASKEVSVNQIHSNCLGWTQQGSQTLTHSISAVLPYQVAGAQYLLISG